MQARAALGPVTPGGPGPGAEEATRASLHMQNLSIPPVKIKELRDIAHEASLRQPANPLATVIDGLELKQVKFAVFI